VLDWPKPELHARIDRRVEVMFAAGLVDEVRQLFGKMGTGTSPEANPATCAGRGSEPVPIFPLILPKPLGKTAGQAVGYREVIEHLEGRRSLPETIALVQQHTRQLAKRQSTWFRSLSECRFIAVSGPVDAAETAERIESAGGTRHECRGC
jgi:tRNA dimethylallyltransferase